MEHFLGLFAIPQAYTSHSEEDELLKWDAQRWHKEDNDPQKDGQYTEVWEGNRLCKERKVGGPKTVPCGTSDVTFLGLDEAPSPQPFAFFGLRKVITMSEVGLYSCSSRVC